MLKRTLSIRFHNLSLNNKTIIANKLKLSDPNDAHLNDFERFRKVLVRASDQGMSDQLEIEMLAIEESE